MDAKPEKVEEQESNEGFVCRPKHYLGCFVCLTLIIGAICGTWVAIDERNSREFQDSLYPPASGPPPDNNACADAIELQVIDSTTANITEEIGVVFADNVGAASVEDTFGISWGTCVPERAGNLWYTFTAPANDTYVVSTCQGTVETDIFLFISLQSNVSVCDLPMRDWDCVSGPCTWIGQDVDRIEACNWQTNNIAVEVEATENSTWIVVVQGDMRGQFGVKVERGVQNPCSCPSLVF